MKQFVRDLAVKICDTYILDQQKHEKFISACHHTDVRASQQRSDMTDEGWYKCRYPGCKSTFASNGQCRRTHEGKHNPPVNVPEDDPTVDLFFEDDPSQSDDMYNYQKSLLVIGMLIIGPFTQQQLRHGTGQIYVPVPFVFGHSTPKIMV